MKTRIQKLLVGAALVGAATLVQAQFSYNDNGNGTCTITGYTGPGGAVNIPNSLSGLIVVSIGFDAFESLSSLTSVTIPNSVTSVGDYAFSNCSSLTAAYFLGNAPPDPGAVFGDNSGPDPATIYYLPGTRGWGPFFSGVPTELWNPQASALCVTGGHFGFDISGPSNTVIVVEACTNLAHPVWLPVSTNALNGNGASSFSDSQSANYPGRFYRFRSP